MVLAKLRPGRGSEKDTPGSSTLRLTICALSPVVCVVEWVEALYMVSVSSERGVCGSRLVKIPG